MPALSITLNSEFLVCVATDDFDVVSVSVSGDVLGPERSILRINGGSYPDGQESHYLIWEDERALVSGDAIVVAFLAEGVTSRPGKTIEELYPEEMPSVSEPFVPPEKMVQELKLKPKAFDSLAFEFIGPEGDCIQSKTSPDEHGFAFTVLWNSQRPERTRVSAHTY